MDHHTPLSRCVMIQGGVCWDISDMGHMSKVLGVGGFGLCKP